MKTCNFDIVSGRESPSSASDPLPRRSESVGEDDGEDARGGQAERAGQARCGRLGQGGRRQTPRGRQSGHIQRGVALLQAGQKTSFQVTKHLGKDCGKNNCDRSILSSRIHEALGLDRATTSVGRCYAGAAPLSVETFYYFQSLDIVIHELLGCTETVGPQSTNLPGKLRA